MLDYINSVMGEYKPDLRIRHLAKV